MLQLLIMLLLLVVVSKLLLLLLQVDGLVSVNNMVVGVLLESVLGCLSVLIQIVQSSETKKRRIERDEWLLLPDWETTLVVYQSGWLEVGDVGDVREGGLGGGWIGWVCGSLGHRCQSLGLGIL